MNLPPTEVRWVGAGDGFTLECGAFRRLWCDGCLKAEIVEDIEEATIVAVKAEHRCGPRESAWGSGWQG